MSSFPEPSPEELSLHLSDNLVRLVQIVFGLVVTQSLLLYRAVLVEPIGDDHWLAALAMVSVFVAVVWSWFDWHEMMVRHPYRIGIKDAKTGERRRRFPETRDLEKLRFISDLAVVTVYAYLLFSIEHFVLEPRADISRFLLGWVLIALTYLASGTPRQMVFGWQASNTWPIIQYLALTLAILVSYLLLRPVWRSNGVDVAGLNAGWIAMCILLTFAYRRTRRAFSDDRRERKRRGPRIGVDVDGVLGDQIRFLLVHLKAKLGRTLTFDDITEWNLNVDGTDIAIEIRELMVSDPEYTLSMPRHRHARRMLRRLFESGRVVIVTARPEEATERTRRWLLRNRLAFDDIEPAREAMKSAHELDVLVDDYQGNIEEFLSSSDKGVAVLVARPWNTDRGAIDRWIPARLRIAGDLADVPGLIEQLLALDISDQ